MKFNIDAFKRFNTYVNTEEKVPPTTTQIDNGGVFNLKVGYVLDLDISSSVPGIPKPDQQLSGGLQHACPLHCSLSGSIRKPD